MKIRCICGAETELPDELSTAKSICGHCGRIFAALNTERLRERLSEPPAPSPRYDWLSIPPEECPPDYYRLLGAALWEEREMKLTGALSRRLEELAPFLQTADSRQEAERLTQELEQAAATLRDPDRRQMYAAQERQRRAHLVEAWIQQGLRRGPLEPAAIQELCLRTERLGLRRAVCLQQLQSRGVDTTVASAKSGPGKVILCAIFLLASLGLLCYSLWRMGWLSLGRY